MAARPPSWKIQMAISPRHRPIYSVFGYRMGFSKSADRMTLFPVSSNLRWRPENSNGDISAADRTIYSVFGSMMGLSVSADRMALIPF